jgi:hypothetical protein
VIAPFFSERARRRRAALRQLRRELHGAYVGFVLRFPLEDVAEDEYRDPLLLSANARELRIQTLDRSSVELAAPWKDVSPIVVEYAPATQLMPVMVFTTTVGSAEIEHRFLGGHSSGTFALSIQQLQRMSRAIERKRPHSPIRVVERR